MMVRMKVSKKRDSVHFCYKTSLQCTLDYFNRELKNLNLLIPIQTLPSNGTNFYFLKGYKFSTLPQIKT